MPHSHLRRWRIGSAICVLVVWLGFALNVADGSAGVWDAVVAVIVPATQYAAFWSPASGMVRNAERRRARERVGTPSP